MANNQIITVQDIPITITKAELADYICITDIAAAKSDNVRAADVVKNWIRNRATLEFLGTWEQIYNPNFKVVEFDHFKAEEQNRAKLEWDAKRFLSKNNYFIQTSAIKNYILPAKCSDDPDWLAYAEEADILNVALFGFTAKAWRNANPELAKKYNVRDFATIHELTVLSNLETHNADMIRDGISKAERFEKLRTIAKYQLAILQEAEKVHLPQKDNLQS